MLSTNVGCFGGGGGTVCRPVSAEEMPRSPTWELLPAESPSEPIPDAFAVMVMSEPSGARVFLDDRALGETPLRVALPAGPVSLRAELDGYAVATHSFDLDQDLDARVTMVTEEEASRPAEICEHRGRGFVVA